jgi:hypothetical protein
MFSALQTSAVKAAIRANELGSASPYALSFAKLGSSGASFGVFQGDMHANPAIRTVLQQVLHAAAMDAATVARIVGVLSAPCPNGNPLSPQDALHVNTALGSTAGAALIDAMDAQLLQTVLTHIQQAVDAAAFRKWTLADRALLYIALWSNMTGAPGQLCTWIGGQTISGVAPPHGPIVAEADLRTYLSAQSYFQQHPANFIHFKQSVAAGAALFQPVAMV